MAAWPRAKRMSDHRSLFTDMEVFDVLSAVPVHTKSVRRARPSTSATMSGSSSARLHADNSSERSIVDMTQRE
ncbi:hypothetical protein PHO31112_02229 [Pandoraea horticolens]|uniref:Uncharacterized protein n=1 Tax=Pandoraea horticolens TaxID=2508298 RepID=A0A5E4UTP0_9BURK|nr:hypothetical protein PHO31112_02229 [Pandoraea horticolens]